MPKSHMRGFAPVILQKPRKIGKEICLLNHVSILIFRIVLSPQFVSPLRSVKA